MRPILPRAAEQEAGGAFVSGASVGGAGVGGSQDQMAQGGQV